MAKRYTNDQAIHGWAQQNPSKASGAGNGAVSFQGTQLYSYSTVIAKFYTSADDRKYVLLWSGTYGNTTTGHQSKAGSAVRHHPVFRVPTVTKEEYGVGEALDHGVNLAYLAARLPEYVATQKRARYIDHDMETRIRRLIDACNDYATCTGTAQFWEVTPNANEIFDEIEKHHADRIARNDTPAKRAKREADKVRATAIRDAEAVSRVAGFYAGSNARVSTDEGTALCRVDGDTLRTSWGATVPLKDAIRVFSYVKRVHDGEVVPLPNRIPCGHFIVDRIDTDGTLHVGCHRILWREIEVAAKQAGVL